MNSAKDLSASSHTKPKELTSFHKVISSTANICRIAFGLHKTREFLHVNIFVKDSITKGAHYIHVVHLPIEFCNYRKQYLDGIYLCNLSKGLSEIMTYFYE
jgi:hypothetical protein